MQRKITVRGSRVHNLKNVSLDIPHDTLVVFTGLSGSGKSSLAFDTIYAEGQRRFMESLSGVSKQFMENIDKPDVDSIEGLPPTVAIDQRTSIASPRSTVGTATEIYDYLRLLFSKIGVPHCMNCKKAITALTRQEIIHRCQAILKKPSCEALILAPLALEARAQMSSVIDELQRNGYTTVRFDNALMSLRDLARLEQATPLFGHTLEVLVDRIEVRKGIPPENRRLVESIRSALELGDGTFTIAATEKQNSHASQKIHTLPSYEELTVSERLRCVECGFTLPQLEPALFSFNNPRGACQTCTGLGYLLTFDPDRIITNPKLTVAQGAIQPVSKLFANSTTFLALIEKKDQELGFSVNIPINEFTQSERALLLWGTTSEKKKRLTAKEGVFEGVIPYLETKYRTTDSEYLQRELEAYMKVSRCHICEGKRLRPELLHVTIGAYSIDKIVSLSVEAANTLISSFLEEKNKKNPFSATEFKIAKKLLKEMRSRLQSLENVGLNYLVLDRSMPTLSGGEAQRVKLANHVNSSLVGVVYVMDEPSIGLHPRDTQQLLRTMQNLKAAGNTVLVVEHEKAIIMAADLVVDVGPGAGKNGGAIVACAPPQEIITHPKSLTGKYLAGTREIKKQPVARKGTGSALTIRGAKAFNLKNISVAIPLGKLVFITGVSGSGKSTLIIDILSKALMKKLYRSKEDPGEHDSIEGVEHIDKIVCINQEPIGRTPRSNPATYTNVFTPVRELFTELPEAKIKGFTPGHFSFNVKGGRCETCQGEGMMRIDMRFLSDVFVECRDCAGKRYNPEALEIHYNGLSIADVLNLTVDEAKTFFEKTPAIHDKLHTVSDVGLGYIKLGQPATTLSGGEAQRIKLAAELSRRQTGKTLYILDEPTIGLHFEDMKQLLNILNQLVDKGNTVVIIEHNIDIIKNGDWVIDLGPEGGDKGGELLAEGTPQEVAKNPKSWTGKFLKEALGTYEIRSQKN
ncbi:excinuclease ABC subunit UvrA [Candidatus Uhrbacteria bacterium]|nr:excinuclease ABC subunit UvrA [Candidatus Uhrbacteria bacterium]